MSAHSSDAERMFAIAGLAFFAKALLPFVAGFEAGEFSMRDAAVGNRLEQVIGGSIYIVSACLLMRDRRFLRISSLNPALVVFMLLVLLSTAWSAAADVTLKRSVGLFGTAIFAAWLAARFTPNEVLRMVAAAFALATALSVAVIVFVPSYGTASGREIAGVYGQKNDLGRAMVFASLAAWAFMRGSADRRPFWMVPAFVTALGLALLCKSAQALVGLFAGFVVLTPVLILLSRRFRKVDLRLGIPLVVIAAMVWFAVTEFGEDALELLGRDATLTDRTIIWELLIDFGWERPWLGHGYGAFWFSDVSTIFADRWGGLEHAHNGYMDLWLELGHVGVGAFVLLLLTASRDAWNVFLARPSATLRFFPIFLVVGSLMNCVGRVFPTHNSIYWVLLCYCAMMRMSRDRVRSVSAPAPSVIHRGRATARHAAATVLHRVEMPRSDP